MKSTTLLLLAFMTFSPCVLIAGEPELTLKWAAGDRFLVGVSVSSADLTEPLDTELLNRHFSIITPENCMKPQSIHPREHEYRFEETDEVVAYARANGLQMVGHCLVWAKDDRTSRWMMVDRESDVGREVLLRRIDAHIETVVGRYADDVVMWDVVNEAIADSGEGLYRDSIYTRSTGDEFIARAFHAARQNDPSALLIYNDYDCHRPQKREKIIQFLTDMKQRGVPIDAYGIQGHLSLGDDSVEQLRITFNELRRIGMKVVVTELDIDVVGRSEWWADNGSQRERLRSYDPFKDGCPEDLLIKEAEHYAALFQLFVENADIIERISFWNLHDGRSWLNYFPWRRTNYPLLFDRERLPKPAFHAVINTLTTPASAP